MQRIPVWDVFVRITHWTVAVLVIADLTVFDADWAIHRWAGYVVLGLVALRLAWGLIGTRYARFTAFPPSMAAARAYLGGLLRGRHERYLSHNPLGALMAYNLWASLVIVCVTGVLMTTETFWGSDLIEALHEIVANWVMICVLLHVGGVIFDTYYSKVNLVRAMLNGVKEIPGDARGRGD